MLVVEALVLPPSLSPPSPGGTCDDDDDDDDEEGKQANILSRYSNAIWVVVTGGFKLGITIALPNWCTTCSSTLEVAGPSRK